VNRVYKAGVKYRDILDDEQEWTQMPDTLTENDWD
jgi:predicted RNA-binding protein